MKEGLKMLTIYMYMGTFLIFVRFPKIGGRRRKWELALRRDGFVASDRTMLCSDPFMSEDCLA